MPMTNDLVLATSVLVFAAGCSDEADIGIDSDPMECSSDGAPILELAGTVTNPFNSERFDFADATAIAQQRNDLTTLQLTAGTPDRAALLRFSFYCGPTELASYGVVADGQQGLACPYEVASVVIGSIEYLPASSGVMHVDQNSNCFAGRFRADFDEYGSVGGAFSLPWTFAQ